MLEFPRPQGLWRLRQAFRGPAPQGRPASTEGSPCDACSSYRRLGGSASGILQCCLCCAAPSRTPLPLHTDAGQIPAHLSEAPGHHHGQEVLLLDPPGSTTEPAKI